jgi:tetratricopeptide (TPR) repeat protein
MINFLGLQISLKLIAIVGFTVGVIGAIATLAAWRFPRRAKPDKRMGEQIDTIQNDVKETNETIKGLEDQLGTLISTGGISSAPRQVLDRIAKGVKLMREGNWGDAIAKFREAMREAKARQLVFLYNLIAVCCLEQGKFDLAITNWHKSIDLAKDCKDKEGEKTAIGNIRLIFQSRGYSSKVLKNFKGF